MTIREKLELMQTIKQRNDQRTKMKKRCVSTPTAPRTQPIKWAIQTLNVHDDCTTNQPILQEGTEPE